MKKKTIIRVGGIHLMSLINITIYTQYVIISYCFILQDVQILSATSEVQQVQISSNYLHLMQRRYCCFTSGTVQMSCHRPFK